MLQGGRAAAVEIFGEIGRFLPSQPKRCICYPRNFWTYWTNLILNYTVCSYYIAIEYFLIGMTIL